MTASAPEELSTDGHCLIVLERLLLAAAPQEGCALLLGRHRQHRLELLQVWPCCNSWEPKSERTHQFQLDAREQLHAQRWARLHGLQVIGAAHSHPSSPAVPSKSDRTLCLGPTLILIRTGLERGQKAFRAWWLPEADPGPAEPVELTLTVQATPPTEHLGE